MVGFATLILGLVLGLHDVELVTSDSVARVELLLDGTAVGQLCEAPWTAPVDFGIDLQPHELEAVGFDGSGHIVGRARQSINRPRPPADISMVVERRGSERVLRLAWQSLSGGKPASVSVTLDGEPLRFTDPKEFLIPSVDVERMHVVRAELEFTDGVSASEGVTFGGRHTDEVLAQLTALPVVLAAKAKLPAPSALDGWFETHGKGVRVAAVEEGPAEVVFVPDGGAREALYDMARRYDQPFSGSFWGSARPMELKSLATLRKHQRARLVWPNPARRAHSGFQFDLFPRSEDFSARDGGLLWFLTRTEVAFVESEQRLSDAVAVAGLSAAGRDRRRAVVLVVGNAPEDRSRLSPETARHYLESLRVPLHVWCAYGSGETPWGRCTDVSSPSKLDAAASRLSKQLEQQRIVWLEGSYLPAAVGLGRRAAGVALLR
jgi:hypothetical protein